MAFELQPRASNAVAMVRAGEEAHLYSWCRDNGYVTIGWFGRPPVDVGGWSLGQLETRFRAEYPYKGEGNTPGAYGNQAAQTRGLHNVADFLFNLPVGRKVVISSPDGCATVMLGEVVGPYEFHADWDITTRFGSVLPLQAGTLDRGVCAEGSRHKREPSLDRSVDDLVG